MGYGVIPDLLELERWIAREGLTAREAAERYASRGEHVPQATIATARWRHGWTPPRPDHTSLIPWVVAPEHSRRFDHVMLEAESRRRQGLRVPERREKQLDSWLRRLERDGAVVHYNRSQTDPETGEVPGWWRVQRRPGIDFDIISMPDLDDPHEVARLRPGAPDLLRKLAAEAGCVGQG